MNATLEDLLDVLTPDAMIGDVERRSQQARGEVSWPDELFSGPDGFLDYLIGVMRAGERHMLNLPEAMGGHDGHYRSMCHSLLNEIYGSSGLRTAFHLATSGEDGGLYSVVSQLLGQMAGMYAGNEIESRINACWNSLSHEDKLAAPDEYLARYGHLLPPELVEGSAPVVRARFPEVLKNHVRLLKDLARVGR